MKKNTKEKKSQSIMEFSMIDDIFIDYEMERQTHINITFFYADHKGKDKEFSFTFIQN